LALLLTGAALRAAAHRAHGRSRSLKQIGEIKRLEVRSIKSYVIM
jgi:hypothetical protein